MRPSHPVLGGQSFLSRGEAEEWLEGSHGPEDVSPC